MKQMTYNVLSKDEGRKIKSILRCELGISNAVLTSLKKSPDGILLNGKRVYVNVTVKEGDTLEIRLVDKLSGNIVPADIALDIIYEDEDILVVNKPRGMPTHPSHNHHNDTLANGVMYHFKDFDFTFRVITRLDKDTSGAVIIAKNKISASNITREMMQGGIIKEYEAICHGTLEGKGTIDAPIGRVPGSAILRYVTPDGKTAITEYESIEHSNGLTYVRLKPITGRTHQLRVHLAHLGHPIYGDDLYGSPLKDEKCRLHCRKVTLTHPETGKRMTFDAPLARDMDFKSMV